MASEAQAERVLRSRIPGQEGRGRKRMDKWSKDGANQMGQRVFKTNGIIWVGTAPFDTYGSATAFLRWMCICLELLSWQREISKTVLNWIGSCCSWPAACRRECVWSR